MSVIAIILYISFVFGFTAYYVFVDKSMWHWSTKVVMTILSTPLFAIILPCMCGVYMAIQYIKELEER